MSGLWLGLVLAVPQLEIKRGVVPMARHLSYPYVSMQINLLRRRLNRADPFARLGQHVAVGHRAR